MAEAKSRTLTPSIVEINNEWTYSSNLLYALSHARGQLYLLHFTMIQKAGGWSHCLHAFFEQTYKKKPRLGVAYPLNEVLKSFSKTIRKI